VVRPDRVQRVPRSTTRETIDADGARYSGLPEQIAEFRRRGGRPEDAGLSEVEGGRKRSVKERLAEATIRYGGRGVGLITAGIPGAAAAGAGAEALIEDINARTSGRPGNIPRALLQGGIEGAATGAVLRPAAALRYAAGALPAARPVARVLRSGLQWGGGVAQGMALSEAIRALQRLLR